VNSISEPDGAPQPLPTSLARADGMSTGDGRGLPSWVAVGWAVGLSVAAAVFDLHVNHTLGTPFAVGYALGCVGAVVVVRPRGLFGVVAEPPLILLLAVAAAVVTAPGHNGMLQVVLAIGTQMLSAFPLTAVVTGVGVAIGAIRWLAARRRR
jgi:hypothetical protein